MITSTRSKVFIDLLADMVCRLIIFLTAICMSLRHFDCNTTTAAIDVPETTEVLTETATMSPDNSSEMFTTDSASASSELPLVEKGAKTNDSLFFEVIKVRKKTDAESGRSILEKVLEVEGVQDRSEHSKALNEDFSPESLNNLVSTTFEASSKSGNTTASSGVIKDSPEKMENLTAAPLLGEQPPFPFPGKNKLTVGNPVVLPYQGCPNFCQASQYSVGTCSSSEDCYHRGGSSSGPCCGGFLVCCHFTELCGGTSVERLVNFQSPNYPVSTRGTLACDFELTVGEDVCAVRVDYVHVRLYGRLGGVCDVDQILILNSADGPTSAQCGDLTGYTTTVAVRPGQEAPLKIVIIVQNTGFYRWDIRLRQIRCTELRHFRRPPVCGAKIPLDTTVSFYQLLDLWRNAAWYTTNEYTDAVWWRDPGPAFNRFYYETTRKALQSGGRPEEQAQDRIIGGSDADLHEFPWQVAIILKRVFFCGGAVINDEYVLSAAHCFLAQDTPVEDLIVFLGDHDLTSSNDTISDVRGVKRVHYHAHFHALLLSNDIALIQLDRPVSFSQRIRPICLPDPHSAVLGLSGTVSGWGITSYPDGKPNAILQKLEVEVMSNEFCETALNEDLGPGNLCAVPRGKQGTCFGDSGGPMTVTHQNKDTLIGIVSFGITGCAMAPGMPDLYTRVSEYLQWIDISAIKYFE